MKAFTILFLLTIALVARGQTSAMVDTNQARLIAITNYVHMYATNCDALAVKIQRLGFLADAATQQKNAADAQKYTAEESKLMSQYTECERRIAVLTQEADRIKAQAGVAPLQR